MVPENRMGSWGIIDILLLKVLRPIFEISTPSMMILPSLISTSLNNAVTRELLPAPVLPFFNSNNYCNNNSSSINCNSYCINSISSISSISSSSINCNSYCLNSISISSSSSSINCNSNSNSI